MTRTGWEDWLLTRKVPVWVLSVGDGWLVGTSMVGAGGNKGNNGGTMDTGDAGDVLRTSRTKCRIPMETPAATRQKTAIAKTAFVKLRRSKRLNLIEDEQPQKLKKSK